ncbi:Hypoxia-inducible factor 1-alpha inhibitor [Hondaea fermentalgiana]|uniref:Hypoxia-inducible factor 1-alpha inhibitor n=1 Tax=Hondaea fermentalgiana TaxID=2315210 RepID=A0A2R5GDX0_9STRA|nr:Hypoxia-inducible factor 1-alpha inhibitor [Hondaea fermentalgiana]|eukprot:GBG25984.1 Hypoxia-inducible factor 1-alpha inhibitor [Hondaea fermentalgiana]
MGVNSRRRPRNKREENAAETAAASANATGQTQPSAAATAAPQTAAGQPQVAEASKPRTLRETAQATVPAVLGGVLSVGGMLLVSYVLSADPVPPPEASPDYAVPSWLEVTDKVPRLSAVEVARRQKELFGLPVVVTESKWSSAVEAVNYTHEDWPNVFPEITKVRKLLDKEYGPQNVFLYEDNTRMMREWDADGSRLGGPAIEVIDDAMSTRDFMDSEEPLYFSHKLVDDYKTTLGAAFPVAALRILSSFSPMNRSDEDVFKANFWLTPDNVIAGMHYDLGHNMFGQIAGCKRFLIVNSTEWMRMQLFPLHHPNDRQSQWELLDDDTVPLDKIPAMVADLGPGDTLYMPPLTFHRVATFPCQGGRHSASINAWSRAAPEVVLQATQHLNNLPAIFASVTSDNIAEALPSLAYYLGGVLASIVNSTTVPQFIDKALVEQRYMATSALSNALSCGSDFDASRCPASVKDPVANLHEASRAQLDRDIRTMVTLFQEHQAYVPSLEILVADFVERVVTLVVGLPKVCTMLRCLAASPYMENASAVNA